MKTERNILLAFILNLFFAIFEFFGGLLTNSVAILSDAIHDLGDSLSIGVSYYLEKVSKRKPDDNYTYGYGRYSVIGSVITTTILLIGSLIVLYNAVKRIINPVSINYNGMLIFAIVGVVVNFLAAYYTKEGGSLNQKSVNLHMLEDVLGWLVVLVGSVIMSLANISIIDPLLSIGVSLFILIKALKNLKLVIDLFLEKTPKGINVSEIKKHLLEIKGVIDIHHIHIWSFDGINKYATMHVVVDKNAKVLKDKIKNKLHEYDINHVTIEFETKEEKCVDVSCEVKHELNAHHH